MTCCKQAMSRGKGPPPLLSIVKGLLGWGAAGSQRVLPLAECTSLRGPYFRQEKKHRQVLTKGLPYTQGPQEKLPAGSLLSHPILHPPGLVAPARSLSLPELRTQIQPHPLY